MITRYKTCFGSFVAVASLCVAATGCGGKSSSRHGASGATAAATTSGSTTGPGATDAARVSDCGDPSPQEQELLEIVNAARQDPSLVGLMLGIDMSAYSPQPPLSHSRLLATAAEGHTNDMIARDFFGHVNPDGRGPADRIAAAGYAINATLAGRDPEEAEKIGAAMSSALAGMDLAQVLAMLPPEKLQNLLDAALGAGGYARNHEVGLSLVTGATTPRGYDAFFTLTLASSERDRPFVVGVAFDDANGDGIANAGEGRGGVSVSLTDSSGESIQLLTATAGGFAFEILRDGEFTLESGGATTQITVQGKSVKADLIDGRFER